MGTVHAKDHGVNYEECQPAKQLPLSVPARVDRINVEGLGRTKNDIVETVVRDIFTAKTFEDVLFRAHKARLKLDQLNLFRNIAVHVDVSRGRTATPEGVEVTFQVKELRRVVGGVTTEIGNNNEGALVVGMRAPNLAGRGERIQADYSYGSKRTNNFNVAFVKPLVGARNPVLSANLYQKHSEWPMSGFKLLERGVVFDVGFTSLPMLQHHVQYDACIRDLGVLSRTSSFHIREESGATLKSSVRHILAADLRVEPIFPTCGALLQLTTELAGLGGNVAFVKNELYAQANRALVDDVVVQATLAAGLLSATGPQHQLTVHDRFHLGGPLSMRGFKARGIGPRAGDDALGALCYLAAGLHVFTPLPFRPGRAGFGDLFRTHLFVNVGNVADPASDELVVDQLKANMRVAAGIGVALRLGQMARVEVNYCLPLSFKDGDDHVNPGVQFGVGVQFI